MPALTATPLPHSLKTLSRALALTGLLLGGPALGWAAGAAAPAEAESTPAFQNSRMDSALFYQTLVSEVQARSGNVGTAYQIYLELARKHRNPELFKRAVEIALQARAGEEALTAAKAWRQASPQSKEAAEFNVQILLALGRSKDLVDPLKSLIQLSPTPQQPAMIASLPRSLARLSDRQAAAQVIDEVTQPWRTRQPALAEAWVASGEGWLAAKDTNKAMDAAKKAKALQPQSLGAGLLAINLMEEAPGAEDLIRQQLERSDAPPLLRLAYARKLAGLQRMSEAAEQLDAVVKAQPDQISAWLTLAAVRLELHQPDQAEVALQHFLALKKPASGKSAGGDTKTGALDPVQLAVDADTSEEQAYTLLAQVEEQRGNWQAALEWLQRVEKSDTSLLIQSQRAKLMAKQGKLAEGRALIRAMPESEPRDALAKLQAETQLLRDLNEWDAAYAVMAEANQRFPDDADLLYEQAMLAEHQHKYDEMEKLLRRAIELKPDNANAYNALGYSLADRNLRLDEARALIRKALDLRPGDPFITDSLGWLEFRSGRINEALALLRQAYKARPDPEIAAHLGEVMWSQGERDEAIKVWRKAQARDAKNESLLDTIKRLQVQL
ncbi:tetratricopeptide repeat protein [Aquabacterium sp. CECT 9606]|uniref:tetratricopeptide repeat protein n=1 Tax=Aquabacterium sp. CECT 9606 TaxID=2845822 RepID=UPI001E2F0289|nr:tetratricopeptide repeat protein [Aquabacterium sp. CECT 9606]CAH0349524.1 Beta-barrel assembly-enhancing protease [Aquabacterium sp. CECT 9606]